MLGLGKGVAFRVWVASHRRHSCGDDTAGPPKKRSLAVGSLEPRLNNLGCPPRVYEVWPDLGEDSRTRPDISWSKNEAVSKPRFCCCGRCVTGPDIDLWYNLCTWPDPKAKAAIGLDPRTE